MQRVEWVEFKQGKTYHFYTSSFIGEVMINFNVLLNIWRLWEENTKGNA